MSIFHLKTAESFKQVKIESYYYHFLILLRNLKYYLLGHCKDLHMINFINFVIIKEKLSVLLKIQLEKFLEHILTLILIKVDNIRQAKKTVLFSYSEIIKQLTNQNA